MANLKSFTLALSSNVKYTELHATGCRDLKGTKKAKKEVLVPALKDLLGPATFHEVNLRPFPCCGARRMAAAGRA